jgi:uncharacterized protein YfaS (alpha-2-macroglobulin family)
MFKIICTLCILVFLQINLQSQTMSNYSKEWAAIEADIKNGKSKDAYKKTYTLFETASKANNAAHAIRAVMHLVSLRNDLEEESEFKAYWFMDSLINKATSTTKNILYSMQAQYLNAYLNNVRWQRNSQTAALKEDPKDIQTWSVDKMNEQIGILYNASLNNATLLQNTLTSKYDVIVLKGTNTNNLRPTLYDLLTFRALEFFSSEERYITKPAYYFEINQKEAFNDVADFVKHKFTTKDTESHHYKALLLYQQLLDYRKKTTNIDALIDADITRLKFVNLHSTLANKQDLYLAALSKIATTHPNNKIAANALELITESKVNNATAANRVAVYKQAIADYKNIILQFPKSEAAINAKNALNDILNKNLNVVSELVNIPNEPFRINIEYKNIEKAITRVIPITKKQFEATTDMEWDKQFQNYAKMKFVKEYTFNFPLIADYDKHSVEAKIDALPIGMYLILTSINSNFENTSNIISANLTHVSNIGYIKDNSENFQVVNRTSGQPLDNASVNVWKRIYDYESRKNKTELFSSIIADKNGMFKVTPSGNDNYSYQFEFKHNSDKLELLSYEYIYRSYDNQTQSEGRRSTELFTDRAIYRPGQTMYFKGIVYGTSRFPFEAKVLPNQKVTIDLMDANYQKVKSIDLITNDFGSYNGSFVLPSNGLTGNFHIKESITHANKVFKVEEYKRPKFEVKLDQPEATFKVNDTVKLKALAKAYAGNNIDGANVKYTVTRKVNYPMWCYDFYYYRGGYWPGNNESEVNIANGTGVTNEKGEFEIKFKALPDASVDRKYQPTFNYEINVEITDINGETRVGNTNVGVRYQAINLEIPSINKVMAHNVQKINVNSTNNSGVFAATKVNLVIKKLEAPKSFIRKRYWPTPDQFLYTKEQFKTWFPLDEYHNESAKQNWPATKVYTAEYITEKDKAHALVNTKLTAGHYVIEAFTIDISGDTVKAIDYIELDGDKKDYFTYENNITTEKESYQPNDTLTYTIQSDFDNIYAMLTKSFGQKMGKDAFSTLPINFKSKFKEQITVTETDRGDIGLGIAFVKHNRFFNNQHRIHVPWSNKDLAISFGSFRDNTLPGSKEQFTVTIKGEKNSLVATEMLATMYDASLDQLTNNSHKIEFPNIYPSLYQVYYWNDASNFRQQADNTYEGIQNEYLSYTKTYDQLGVNAIEKKKQQPAPYFTSYWWGDFNEIYTNEVTVTGYGTKRKMKANKTEALMASAPMNNDVSDMMQKIPGVEIDKNSRGSKNEEPTNIENGKNKDAAPLPRKNFNETAFFLPNLTTDKEGNIIVNYTIPEALTKWKLQTLAHTKNMQLGYAAKEVITQKPLMVQPNLPRFLREGDKVELAIKIVNLTDKEITGTSNLALINPETNQAVDGWFKNMFPQQFFTIAANQSTAVVFPIEIPFGYNKPLILRATAIEKLANNVNGNSDAEENIVPVVTNRMLVTETMPMYVNGNTTKTFSFDKLKNNTSQSLQSHGLTIEYSPNPIWYAVQALPYLMEYPYDCAEQTFNRFYANALAEKIANSTPKIRNVFNKWATQGNALQSNLEKNQELKSAVLTETPWVLDAQNEAQQKKNIAVLFDVMRMANERETALRKLQDLQTSNGGFSWFKGGPDNQYITQFIVSGFGHLQKLSAINNDVKIQSMLERAVNYLDARIVETYNIDSKQKTANSYLHTEMHYLYMRSFFSTIPLVNKAKIAHDYYLSKISKIWLQQSKYTQALMALVANRNNDAALANKIIESLKQNSIVNDELGMYWKDVTSGYYWYQNPIETMSTIIEAFNEITTDTESVAQMQKWLLKNKQTTNWKTTKATAEACYALLIPSKASGKTALTFAEKNVAIQVGSVQFTSKEYDETGTGYLKKRIEGEMVKPEHAQIKVTVSSATNDQNAGGASFGAAYWQYFEDLDKITPAVTPLKLQKKIYKEIATDKGKKLQEVKENDVLQIGDKMVVQLVLKSDRDMEYLHLKDMRSSGVEPVNVLSTYKWQNGLGYYESTKDISSNFFISYLPKGTYVFEYPVYVSHKGNFSNGIATIQCMYAPEFSSHSQGVKVTVE